MIAAGKQSDAELLIRRSIRSSIEAGKGIDPDEAFLMGVLMRSRFDLKGAGYFFQYVANVTADTPRGQASELIVKLDSIPANPDELFNDLCALATKKPADPLLLWMAAVQCRSYHKPAVGIPLYAELCKLWKPGPALVHHTYANLFDDLDRFDEALFHRKLAVQLEPDAWVYDGLGNTLSNMKRWAEADDAYAHATAIDPSAPEYWLHWSHSKRNHGDTDSAAILQKKYDSVRGLADGPN